MRFSLPLTDVSGAEMPNWDYSRDAPLENIFLPPIVEIPSSEEDIRIEPFFPRVGKYEETQYVITGPALPYLPPKVTRILERGKERKLSAKEFSKLMETIANISIKFYNIIDGKYVAIGLNGRVVEAADSQLDLLSKIQGVKFNTQVFVWHAGSDVFSGWTT